MVSSLPGTSQDSGQGLVRLPFETSAREKGPESPPGPWKGIAIACGIASRGEVAGGGRRPRCHRCTGPRRRTDGPWACGTAESLLEDPPSYTSLAFAQPQSLPERLHTRLSIVKVSFVIHNSGGPGDYQWSVLLAQGGSARRVSEGNVHVAPGHGASITRFEDILCTRGPVQIVVSLARPAEQIDFSAACPSAKSSLQRQKDA